MAGKQQTYLSYLLRLWQVIVDGQPVWRASLESAQTGQHRGFASLVQLTAFLETEMAAARLDSDEEGVTVTAADTYDAGEPIGN